MGKRQPASILVLLVESNEFRARAVIESLARADTRLFNITCKNTLHATLRLLQSQPVDIILLDLNLSDSSGHETFEQVRAAAPQIPVVVFSGIDDPEVMQQYLSEGASEFINNIVIRDLLVVVLQNTILRGRNAHELVIGSQRIERLNLVLQAIHNVHQLITREKDPEILLKRACELLVEGHGYCGVCIRVDEHEDIPFIVGSAGWNGGFEDFRLKLSPSWEPPCAVCASERREGAVSVSPRGCADCPLHKDETSQPLLAKLQHGSHDFGVLGVMLPPGVAIDDDEVSLAQEVAVNLALALDSIQAAAISSRREERHQQLFQSMLLGVIYENSDGTIVDANPAAERILGLTRDQLLGRTSMDPRWRTIREDGTDFPGTEHPVMVALQTGREIRGVSMGVYSPAQNATRWIRVSAVPEFRSGEDKPYRAFVTFEDVTEERARVEELRRSEELLAETGAMAQVGGWRIDLETEEVVWTRATRVLHEVPDDYEPTLKEAIGFFPDVEEELTEAIRRAREEGVPYNLELPFVSARGTQLWTHTIGHPEFRDGTCVRLHGTFQDITERKKSEDALREATLRIQNAVKAGRVGLWDWDLTTNKTYYSPEWKAQIGYTDEEISDEFEEWQNRVHPDDLDATIASVQDAIARVSQEHVSEFRFRHKDGSYRWMLAHAAILTDDQGKAVRMIGSHVDITDRKSAEQALRRSEGLFRKVFEILPVGLWIADKNGTLQQGNPAGRAIWGTEPLVDQEEYGVFHARRLPSREEIAPDDWALARTVNEGETISDELLEIDAFDGAHASYSTTPLLY